MYARTSPNASTRSALRSSDFGREQARRHGVTVGKVVHNFKPRSELEIRKRREHVLQVKKDSNVPST